MSNDKPFSLVEFVISTILWLLVFFLLGKTLRLMQRMLTKLFRAGTDSFNKIVTR